MSILKHLLSLIALIADHCSLIASLDVNLLHSGCSSISYSLSECLNILVVPAVFSVFSVQLTSVARGFEPIDCDILSLFGLFLLLFLSFQTARNVKWATQVK